MAVALWTLLGFALVLMARQKSKQWQETEKIAKCYPELQRIKEQYETVFYNIVRNRAGQPQQFDPKMVEKIKYFIMRLQFIHPIYLPSLSE
jgi:hypothetical protein